MTSKVPQTAQIATPQSKDDRSDVKVEEIPLPPSELWAELDNSGAAAPAPSGEAVTAGADDAPEPITDLDFLGEAHQTVITLEHPFNLQGEKVERITVRRLRIGDVDRFIKRLRGGSFSTFEIYAAMTGLPAPVLRGLIDVDGDAVTDACFDFLPRSLRPEPVPPES